MKSVVFATCAVLASAGSDIPLTWNDCSDETYKTKISSLTPDHVTTGAITTISGHGNLKEDVTDEIDFEGQFEASLKDCTGDAQVGKTCNFPMDTGKMGFVGMPFPVKAGRVPVEVDVTIGRILPADALTATVEVVATSASKGQVFCVTVYTKKSPDSHIGQGILDVTWSDCGDSKTLVKVDTLTPSQIKQGQNTKFIGSGILPVDLTEDDVTFDMKLKVQLVDCKGVASKGQKCNFPLSMGYLDFKPIPSPVKAGDTQIDVDLKLSNLIPTGAAASTTHVTAKTKGGENVFCLNVVSAPTSAEPVTV